VTVFVVEGAVTVLGGLFQAPTVASSWW
jgi:hypothetical protein